MIEIAIPGSASLRIEHLVLDYNGTLARDGVPLPRAAALMERLGESVQVHIVTADTFGTAREKLAGIGSDLVVLHCKEQDRAKLEYAEQLGIDRTVCIGNGRNDLLMIKEALLGIAVVQEEGACSQTLFHADIVCKSIVDALELLIHPRRLAATLRNG